MKVDARQETTAEEIFSRCSNDILKAMLTITNSRGSTGAPSHPAIKYLFKWDKFELHFLLGNKNIEKTKTQQYFWGKNKEEDWLLN